MNVSPAASPMVPGLLSGDIYADHWPTAFSAYLACLCVSWRSFVVLRPFSATIKRDAGRAAGQPDHT